MANRDNISDLVGISLDQGFKLMSALPLDVRSISNSALRGKLKDHKAVYSGLLTYDASEDSFYYYKDATNGWVEFKNGGGSNYTGSDGITVTQPAAEGENGTIKISNWSVGKATWANSNVNNLPVVFGLDGFTDINSDVNVKFCSSSHKVNVVIDGDFYANEGKKRLAYLDEVPTITEFTATNINDYFNLICGTKCTVKY